MSLLFGRRREPSLEEDICPSRIPFGIGRGPAQRRLPHSGYYLILPASAYRFASVPFQPVIPGCISESDVHFTAPDGPAEAQSRDHRQHERAAGANALEERAYRDV